jgi:hypothetical protein
MFGRLHSLHYESSIHVFVSIISTTSIFQSRDTALILAIHSGFGDLADTLIAHGAEVNARNYLVRMNNLSAISTKLSSMIAVY